MSLRYSRARIFVKHLILFLDHLKFLGWDDCCHFAGLVILSFCQISTFQPNLLTYSQKLISSTLYFHFIFLFVFLRSVPLSLMASASLLFSLKSSFISYRTRNYWHILVSKATCFIHFPLPFYWLQITAIASLVVFFFLKFPPSVDR